MAQIPIIQDSATLEVGTGRRRVQASGSDFGAAEASGLAQLGQGLGAVAQAAGEIDDTFAEAEARDLDNQFSQRLRERLDNDYFQQRGRGAVEARGTAEADVDAIRDELAAQARPRAQALFLRAANQRRESALGRIASHANTENERYLNTQTEARLNEFIDNAVAGYADAGYVQEQVQAGFGELNLAARRLGWDEDTIAQRQRQFQSDVMRRTIVQLATTDPTSAEELYTRIRPELTADDAAQLLTTMRAAQAQARERVTGAIWQAYANGQDPRQLAEWGEFTSNPLFGREHETFNEYRRQRAASALTNAATTRASELTGDQLEAIGALNPQALMLITDYATGRLDVRTRVARQPAPDMTPSEFQAATGLSVAQARQLFGRLQPDDLLRVLNRRSEQTDNSAIDRAYDDILRVAEPIAQSMGLAVTGTAEANAEMRGAFQAYLYREARDYVAANGARPDDAAIEMIVRRALLRVDRGGRRSADGSNYAFERVPYNNIPRDIRNAIEADWRLRRGVDPSREDVERRYRQYLQAQ